MGTGVTKSLAAGKESEDLGTDKAGGLRCRQGRGYTDGEWGSGAGSLHRETRTGHPRPRALQINHIGPCVEKSFHRCSHFTSRTTNQTSQDGKASLLPPPCPPLPASALPQDTGLSWVLSPSSATRTPKGGVCHSPAPSAHPLSLGGALPCSSKSFPPPPPALLLLSAVFHVLPEQEEVRDQHGTF